MLDVAQTGDMVVRELHEDDIGPEVSVLQARLLALGFSPGRIDGDFGSGTLAAVMAFQRSEGLAPTGRVDAQTIAMLNAPQAPPPQGGAAAAGMPAVTVAIAAKMLPGALLGNIKSNLPIVLDALQQLGLTSAPVVLGALATIRAETAGFVPIGEFVSRFNTSPSGHPFDLYDNRKDLGNRGAPDGARYKGRGFVQLTGRFNYNKFGPVIGESDLEDVPDKANDARIAAKLLAAFIMAKRGIMEQALLAGDFLTARKAVNGGSHGLQDFQDAYTTGRSLLM